MLLRAASIYSQCTFRLGPPPSSAAKWVQVIEERDNVGYIYEGELDIVGRFGIITS